MFATIVYVCRVIRYICIYIYIYIYIRRFLDANKTIETDKLSSILKRLSSRTLNSSNLMFSSN